MPERGELLDTLNVKLERAARANDLGVVCDDDTQQEVLQLLEIVEDDDADVAAHYTLGWVIYCWYQVIGEQEQNPYLEVAIRMFTPCFAAGDPGLPDELLPALAERALPAASALLERARDALDQDQASEAVDLWQRITDALPVDHPERSACFSNMAEAFLTRFTLTGASTDMAASVGASEAALETTPQDHPDWAAHMHNLGETLQIKYLRSGDAKDLEAAISAHKAALAATAPVDARWAAYSARLADSLRFRFRLSGKLADLEASVAALQEAAQATPAGHPSRASLLSSLGMSLLARFERMGQLDDLDAAIQSGREAVAATPLGQPGHAERLSNLGMSLRARFKRLGQLDDLDAAIQAGREAVLEIPDGYLGKDAMLSNLAAALRIRSERTGDMSDLEAAIEAGRGAAALAPPRIRATRLIELAVSLTEKFEQAGHVADLDRAVETARDAAAATRSGAPEYASVLSVLARALRLRFEETGLLADLDGAVEADREAASDTSEDPSVRAIRAAQLAGSLLTRFGRIGSLGDIDEAIRVGRAAADALPGDHPSRAGYLSNLAFALAERFGRTGALADIDQAVMMAQAAVDATPAGDSSFPGNLSSLGNALLARFGRTGELNDLEAAVKAMRGACGAIGNDHLRRATYLSNLGFALQSLFEHTGEAADLEASVAATQAAVDASPAGYPGRSIYLMNLGSALLTRFGRDGMTADRDAASSAFAAAAEIGSASPSMRIRAAREAASLIAQSDLGRAADLLERAISLLPEVAPRQLARSDQQHAVGQVGGLAADAAALALAENDDRASIQQRASRALRLIEAGRAVLLSQALDTRDDVKNLREEHPELAERFADLRDQLDQPEPRASAVLPGTVTADLQDRMAERRIRLVGQFRATLDEIRALPGFQSFGMPPTIGELMTEAAFGPVVTFNISDRRCDAIMLSMSGITSINLTDVTRVGLIQRVNEFHQALDTCSDRSAKVAARTEAQRTITEILGWLWDVAAEPVLNELGYNQCPSPDASWPKVWWAPGGILGLLPVHAAGHHNEPRIEGRPRRAVIDRVISSYTPTIRALRYTRQRAAETGRPARALVIAMPTTPGLPGATELPYVPAEVAAVSALLPHPVILTEPATDAQSAVAVTSLPTRENVFLLLRGCSIIHFACHGESRTDDPSQSQLLLHDHDRNPLTVASLAAMRLDSLELAYLSACDTAFSGNVDLIDETIHLTSAFQLAGSQHVIGTLWAINDALAADIAERFYRELRTSKGTIDTDRAALALHIAVRHARDVRPRAPSLWAAFLHAGA